LDVRPARSDADAPSKVAAFFTLGLVFNAPGTTWNIAMAWFGGIVADVSLIGSTTNLFPVMINQVLNLTLRESASQLPIESSNDRWPLGFIASQLFILRPLDCGDSLVLR